MQSSTLKQLFVTAILLFLSAVAQADDENLFPLPPELEPDVNFWLSVFTRYDTSEGVLHDNRNLAVVYEAVALPEKATRAQRQRVSDKRRQHFKKILQTLASGKRDNLTADEARVLKLWPPDVTNAELAAAVGRIRFQLGLSDRFREGLERAGRWRQHVEAEFIRLGVPVAMAALPHVESSYNPDARSHVGASGIWQFTQSTGRRFMQVDHILDERNDPFLATTAAGKLLAYNYSIAGNWPMAITAYNHGLAGARRAMREFGDDAYVDILRKYKGRTFGFASRNFYVAFLAAKEVDQNPDKYFPGLVPEDPVDYSSVALDAYVSASDLASVLKISEREIASYNPGLQATVWQGSKYLPKDYELRLPSQILAAPLTTLLADLGPDKRYARQLPDLYHTVGRGDTLSQIADAYDTRVSTLVSLNALSSQHRIRIGQKIRLPAAGPLVAASSVASRTAVPPPPAEAPAPVVVAVAEVPPAVDEPDSSELPRDELADEPAVDDMAEEPAIDTVLVVDAELLSALEAAENGEAEEAAPTVLLSDPSDYTVANDNTIEVHPLETLGHYADWLGIRTQRLRDVNSLAFRTPVEVGKRLKLDFAIVSVEDFERLRTDYHRLQQDTFFRNHRITGITEHVVKPGESVWILSLRRYDVPVWLFRQYNPELDLHNVRPGTRLSFPILVDNKPAA